MRRAFFADAFFVPCGWQSVVRIRLTAHRIALQGGLQGFYGPHMRPAQE